MICQYCRSALLPGARYCAHCGRNSQPVKYALQVILGLFLFVVSMALMVVFIKIF